MDAGYPRTYGSYLLLEHLGQGGMSDVELARRGVDEADYIRFMVIKRIHPRHTGDEGFIRMFQDEARINGELQHANIAQVYDFGRVGDEYFLAMEYVPGKDLREIQHIFARDKRPIPLRISLRVLADVLQALDYAHSRVDTYGRPMNIVHRDVNPRNIMLSVRGEVKLIDFGVAKSDTKSEKTVGHTLKGKFAYMAPEQIEGTVRVDGRADVFAMGLILHELMTGASPFAGLNEVQIMHRVLAGRIPPLTRVPGHPKPQLIIDLHARALAHERDSRFADAGEMLQALKAAAEPLGGLATQQEMADFVHDVDPAWADGIARRLHAYGTAQPPPPPPVRLPPPTEGSITLTEADEVHPGRGLALGLMFGVGAIVTIGVVGLALLVWSQVMGTPSMPWSSHTQTAPPVTAAPAPTPTSQPESVTPVQAEPSQDAPPTLPAPVQAAPVQAEPVQAAPVQAEPVPAVSPTQVEPAPSEPVQASPAQSEPPPPEPSQAAPSQAAPSQAAPVQAEPAQSEPPPPAPSQAAPSQAAPPTQPQAPVADAINANTDEHGAAGFLYASSNPARGYEVYVDNVKIGLTPIKNHRLSVGPHTVVIRDPVSGHSWTRPVTIAQGRPQVVRIDGNQ